MNTVTVSNEYQVKIPKEIRGDIGLQVGTKWKMGGSMNITYNDRTDLL